MLSMVDAMGAAIAGRKANTAEDAYSLIRSITAAMPAISVKLSSACP
jgi:hypothetical protein